MQVSEAAWDLLAVMDEQAALANQKVDLFTSQERFPGVFEARASLAAAEKALVWRSSSTQGCPSSTAQYVEPSKKLLSSCDDCESACSV